MWKKRQKQKLNASALLFVTYALKRKRNPFLCMSQVVRRLESECRVNHDMLRLEQRALTLYRALVEVFGNSKF